MASSITKKSVKDQRPDLFQFGNVDRHTCTRVVPMEVLSLGFSRTGTASMQAALEILGYPTYHTYRIFQNLPDCDMWMEAFDAKYFNSESSPYRPLDRKFWDKLLGHVSAITDIPAAAFHEELRAAYPGVKCIMVERDVEAWYKSWSDVQIAAYGSWLFRFVAFIDPYFIGRIWDVTSNGVMGGFIGAHSKKDLEEKSRYAYIKHNKRVRETVPKKLLLEYELGSGWLPLCEFLGKPIPDIPFPRVNETEMVNQYVQVVIRMGLVQTLKRWAVWTAPALVAVTGLWIHQSYY